MMHAPALILVGPSGVGKNTVAEILLGAKDSPFSYSRSLTTRDPRGTYADEYLYVSEQEFLSRVQAGKMLEYTLYGGNYYGTPMSEVERSHSEGKIPLMILDINGVESIRRDHPSLPIFAVYLYADPAQIRDRLQARDLGDGCEENRKRIARRLENNREDFRSLADGRLHLFDAFVENLCADAAAREVLSIFEERRLLSAQEAITMRDYFLRAVNFEF
ncbi:MAG: guanylate kinase [Clostridia bacterium]|nr:guanylate kinase [Clostridia bacterium]